MSNQDMIASQKVTTTDSNNSAFDVTNVLGDWDGLIYTFCYKDKDNLVNGFYQTYCIESWGKSNTVMLMELFKDYDYNITVRKHEITWTD